MTKTKGEIIKIGNTNVNQAEGRLLPREIKQKPPCDEKKMVVVSRLLTLAGAASI